MSAEIFAENEGVFLAKRGFCGAGERCFGCGAKDKKKSARYVRTLLLFFVVYDVLYSISMGLIPERKRLRF